jgi:hypothetical protein
MRSEAWGRLCGWLRNEAHGSIGSNGHRALAKYLNPVEPVESIGSSGISVGVRLAAPTTGDRRVSPSSLRPTADGCGQLASPRSGEAARGSRFAAWKIGPSGRLPPGAPSPAGNPRDSHHRLDPRVIPASAAKRRRGRSDRLRARFTPALITPLKSRGPASPEHGKDTCPLKETWLGTSAPGRSPACQTRRRHGWADRDFEPRDTR